MPKRFCQFCDGPIPSNFTATRRTCSEECALKLRNKRAAESRMRKRGWTPPEEADAQPELTAPQGPILPPLQANGSALDHLAYARDVVEGRILACRNVELACQVALKEHESAPERWVFDAEYASSILHYAAQWPHTKGRWKSECLELEPWQVFFMAEAVGWRARENGEWPRFRELILMMGRKNAKTVMAAVMGSWHAAYGDIGSEIVSSATHDKQAKISWNQAKSALRRMNPTLTYFEGATISELRFVNDGTFVTLARDSKKYADGLNPTFGIFDECHAIENEGTYEVVATGMARRTGQMLYISTAGYNPETPFRQRCEVAATHLERGERGRTFAMLYAFDPEDADDLDAYGDKLIKANPNIDVSVQSEELMEELQLAREIPSKLAGWQIKHACLYAGTAQGFITPEKWAGCRVDEFDKQGQMFLGVDLAKTKDLTSVCALWYAGGEYRCFWRNWLPEGALDTLPATIVDRYTEAEREGALFIQKGTSIISYDVVEKYIIAMAKKYQGVVCTDPAFASELTRNVEAAGIEVWPIAQRRNILSQPIEELERAVLSGRFKHRGMSLESWCMSNVEVVHDEKTEQRYLQKAGKRTTARIDPIDALVTAIAGTLREPGLDKAVKTIESVEISAWG